MARHFSKTSGSSCTLHLDFANSHLVLVTDGVGGRFSNARHVHFELKITLQVSFQETPLRGRGQLCFDKTNSCHHFTLIISCIILPVIN